MFGQTYYLEQAVGTGDRANNPRVITLYGVNIGSLMSTVSVGYMGVPGSNSEQAAKEFAEKMGWESVELLPLVDSRGVIEAMDSGKCEYGVVAVANINAGPVEETANALKGRDDIGFVMDDWVPIHHCVFVKEEGQKIRMVTSHIQAILQCKNNLSNLFPDAEFVGMEDTALAAQYLSEGKYPEGTAVICRRNAGEMFGLTLMYENIEDNKQNMTQFHLLHKG